VQDLRHLQKTAHGRAEEPTAAIFDGRTLPTTPESGHRAGYDGHKRKKGSKGHLAVDTSGHLRALLVPPANEQERAQGAELSEAVQVATGQSVQGGDVDQGDTGDEEGGSGPEAGHPAGSGETARRQARFCRVTPPVGGGTLRCLGQPMVGGGRVITNAYRRC